jgi:hypothetical protein
MLAACALAVPGPIPPSAKGRYPRAVGRSTGHTFFKMSVVVLLSKAPTTAARAATRNLGLATNAMKRTISPTRTGQVRVPSLINTMNGPMDSGWW